MKDVAEIADSRLPSVEISVDSGKHECTYCYVIMSTNSITEVTH